MFKFLKETYKTADELKKAFRDLLMVLHPDKGGSNEDCAQLISEYESLIKRIPKKSAVEREQHKPEAERKYRPTDFYTYDSDFVEALVNVMKIKMDNASVEVCGWFIYVSGNTKPYKDEIKAQGFTWQSGKSMWVWKPAWYSAPKNHKPWEMNKIREYYSSKQVEEERGLVVRH